MTHKLSFAVKINRQRQIIVALMLRDIRTRFFGSSWGFAIAILWPLSHIFALVILNGFAGRATPYGESSALWFATGVVPFMAYAYTARFIGFGVLVNRALLIFPIITIIDIVVSRTIIEILNTCCVIVCVILIFLSLGINPFPPNLVEASYALGAVILLGVGVGVINAIITAAIPAWSTGFALFSLALWIASGVIFVPDALPSELRYILSFNPALQGVEWMRSAYYEGYGGLVLDKLYLLEFALVSLLVGLILERTMRGRLLQG